MPDPVWGTEGSDPSELSDPVVPVRPEPTPVAPPAPLHEEPPASLRKEPVRKQRVDEPVPDWLQSTPYPENVPSGRDPVAVVAVACGFVGIVVAGILFAIITAVLAGLAGQRARESGRTFELPYLAFLLAFVDGAVWIVLHLLIDIPAWIG